MKERKLCRGDPGEGPPSGFSAVGRKIVEVEKFAERKFHERVRK